ncbi:hypothetical protein KM176_00745 [Pseudooceanicola sp. CBS1P-1]|uniref:Antitoxin VbhA domain-containing protein n=1 Tax=Pseudooceanicola albus TaxID=2692189 RepID=A0A6L7G0F7_9RHOB|nr:MULTISPECIES: antitoxin VbhA family protein [Pseudooceanicola]MBT9382374.1 hypothetical protein [Pseudooceanicola endophyticus]MXN16916.1 hypothetical protein [Pseudooceanicola albus]
MSESDRLHRQRLVDEALAHQRLAGIVPDQETIAALNAYVAGDLPLAAVLADLQARYPSR